MYGFRVSLLGGGSGAVAQAGRFGDMAGRFVRQPHNRRKRKQPIDDPQFKENYQSHAEWNIKWYLIKDKIIEAENIDISDAELQTKIEEVISQNQENKKQIEAFYEQSKNKQNFYSEMLNDKLFERLTEFAKVKVVEESTNELRKKQAA